MVEEHLGAETVRPLTDHVLVGAPDPVPYDLHGKWFLRAADANLLSGISSAVARALEEFRQWQRAAPGTGVNAMFLRAPALKDGF